MVPLNKSDREDMPLGEVVHSLIPSEFKEPVAKRTEGVEKT